MIGDPKCDLLHELLNSLTIVFGECELLQDQACHEVNLRLTVIRQRTNCMTEIIRNHQCPQHLEPEREGFIRSIVRANVRS